MGKLELRPLKLRAPYGIKTRWLINSLGISAIIVMFGVAFVAVLMSNYYYEIVRKTVEERAVQSASFFDKYYNNDPEIFYASAAQWALEFKDKNKLELQFVGKNGRVDITSAGLATGMVPRTPDVAKCLATGKLDTFSGVDPVTGERVLSVSAPLLFAGDQVIGAMRFVSSLELVDKQIMRSIWISFLVGVGLIFIVAATNFIFIQSIATAIHEINYVTKRIAAGSYGVRIEKQFNDEIGELVDNINHMSSEINTASRMKTDFMSSVSHELRTPLTAIAGWGETLLSSDDNNPAEMKKGVTIMLKETRRLTRLVEELLDFTRMEGGRMTLYSETLDIASEMDEVVFMMADALRQEGVDIDYEAGEDLPRVVGDKARLKQVFFNILDNAAKHGQAEGRENRIEITLMDEGNTVCLQVRDHGPGIAPEEMPHVRMRFYKGSSKSRGSGIGLAVCDEIIKLHDGTMDIESRLGEGTTVIIHLPVKEEIE